MDEVDSIHYWIYPPNPKKEEEFHVYVCDQDDKPLTVYKSRVLPDRLEQESEKFPYCWAWVSSQEQLPENSACLCKSQSKKQNIEKVVGIVRRSIRKGIASSIEIYISLLEELGEDILIV